MIEERVEGKNVESDSVVYIVGFGKGRHSPKLYTETPKVVSELRLLVPRGPKIPK